jgi:hypothetical protein
VFGTADQKPPDSPHNDTRCPPETPARRRFQLHVALTGSPLPPGFARTTKKKKPPAIKPTLSFLNLFIPGKNLRLAHHPQEVSAPYF